MPNKTVLTHLLSSTQRIIKHQHEKEALRGERFNIFSVLRMETKENGTHSAFLAELLNPKGSHLKDALFLKLFLQVINNEAIATETAKVVTEMYIGQRDDIAKNGGRIDIYIKDDAHNSISIENKIYAVDQYAQIERYCNHRPGKNKVYYLTLHGSAPSIESSGALKADIDYCRLP